MEKLILAFVAAALFAVQPIKSQAQDRDDATTSRIASILASRYTDGQKGQRSFIYNPIDLNDDGKNEYIVGLTGPEFCGNAGCKMLVLSSKFTVLTSINIVNFPVYVGAPGGKEVTKKYSNLYMYARGRGFVKLAWNGKSYPTNPSLCPKIDESITNGKFKFLNEGKDPIFHF